MFSRAFRASDQRITTRALFRTLELFLASAIFTVAPAPAKTSLQQFSNLTQDAENSLASRNFAAAISGFETVLQRSPASMKAEIGLALAYRGVHNYDEARRILIQSRRQHTKSAAPLAALGDLDIEVESYDLAVHDLQSALALNPADTNSRVRLAIAFKAKAEFPEALAQIQKVLARDPQNALAFYTRAQIESDQNQDEDALRDAQQVLKLQPENRLAPLLLGKILVRTSQANPGAASTANCSHAVQILEPLTEDPAVTSETLYLLSRAYQCARQNDKSQETLARYESAAQAERKLKDDQMQVKHLLEQANALALKNDFQGSLDAANQALAVDPHCGPAYSQLAKLYFSSGDLDKASDAITHALEADPYQPDFLFVQGKILEKESRLDAALDSFQRAALINPNESDAFFEMGVIYQHQGDRPRALAAYKKATSLSPDDPDYARALAALSRAAAPPNP
ncbi:MAG TPA: tetratricopeptide repeat protein [Candidatus Acidoferrales bacterium]|nr:tetratricopeptide repeat protein [Candidatus Acidoferrales bacterium]